ncbi:hypothetical protein AB1L07_02495 [Niallia alba]|uniref:hypothetical protein n=1 Tax=Niallia alba TaxID=2729105 RepID=UPI0039A0D2DE
MNLKRNLIGAGLVLVLGGVAVVGNIGELSETASADESWLPGQLAENNAKIAKAGFEKKEEIKSNANGDIKETINGKLSPELEKAQSDLEKMLEEYYQMKLDGLDSSPEFTYLEEAIKTTQASILDRYKKEIDTIFAGQ